ncbi:recombinase family protein [Streptomyces sp. NPDC005962]|uniref:recombinase family protein n=1 Tax=Streptomyces sp. NPDC005962 TaxID=3154466 RepID=UPI0033C01CC1
MAASTLVGEAEHPVRSPEGMGTTTRLRGVRAVRLSVHTDETTSPERQRDADDRAAEALGIDFDGREAVDLDVSASKVGPFDRPELGTWLAKPDEFDALVWWRFDRALRSMSDMHDLAKWAREHRKMLVFAEGVGGGRLVFDFRNPMDPVSELMMLMFAFAAQVEAMSIKERVIGAQAALRMMPLRWKGGRPKYGYMIADMPQEHGGIGKTLVPDPDAVKVIERIIRDLLDGKTINKLCQELRAEKVPTPRDNWSLKAGRKTGGKTGGAKGETTVRERFNWVPSVIRKVLTSPSLIGWKMHDGKPVRDSEGAPVMLTTQPILTRAEFDRIGALFEDRKLGPHDRHDQKSKLLRVIHCAGCESRMYHMANKRKGVQRASYKCTAHLTGIVCPAPVVIRADWVEGYVEREFLAAVGGLEVKKTVITPGYDPAPEIAATLAEYKEHQQQEGRQKSKAAREAWQERADALDNRLAVLESTPKVEEKRALTPTGRTIADEWAVADDQRKRHMLLDAGARLLVRKGTRGGWRTLDESRVSFEIREESFQEAADELRAIREESESENRQVSEGGVTRLRKREVVLQAAA